MRTTLRSYIKQGLIFCSISFFLFFSSILKLRAEDMNWIEVANTGIEIQYIDPNSIKYNKRGFLSVMTKYSEINLEDQNTINTNSYLMAIDCENRLFSKLPVNAELKQVKNWQNPIQDKLTKKMILNICSY